jgi:uncharacterized surface protein with fasciclin (FAS1) repeats
MRTIPGLRFKLFFLSILAAIASWGCNKSNPSGIDYKTSTISYFLINGANTTYFETAIREANLDTVFNGTGPFTVFVPTDDAFNASGISLSAVTAWSGEEARNMVLYHTVAGTALGSSTFIGATELKVVMANGDSVFITGDSNRIFVNGLQVTASDVKAANGIMHSLQGVLKAPSKNLLEIIYSDSSLSFLFNALQLATPVPDSLTSTLSSGGPFTFFAPDNNAFRNAGYNSPQDLDTANADSLRSLILSQLIPARLFSYDIPDSSTVQTVNDSTLLFSLSGITPQVQIRGHDHFVNVVSMNQMAINGVLFKTDEFLIH